MRTAHLLAALAWCSVLSVGTPALAAYSCSVSTGGSINFLSYDSSSTLTASSTVTLTCTHLGGGNENIAWAMTLSNGSSGTCLGATGRTMQRQVAPVATVGYNIYQNSTSTEWGNAGCGTFPGGTLQINNGNPVRSTIQTLRGVMPSGQLVPAGLYLETLVLTVTF